MPLQPTLLKLAKDAPVWLTELKKKQLEVFNNLEYPAIKDEFWKGTKLEIPPGMTHSGESISIQKPETADPNAIVAIPVYDAAREYPELLKSFFVPDAAADKYSAMIDSLFDSGIFVRIPKGMVLKEPLVIKRKPKSDGILISKCLIVLEEGSSAKIIDDFSCIGKSQNIRLSSTIISCGTGSKLDYYVSTRLNDAASNLSLTQFYLEKDAKTSVNAINSGGKTSRMDIKQNFVGEGSESKMTGAFSGQNKQHFDIITDSIHKTRNTKCDIVFKCVLADKSSAIHRGKITIEKAAQLTNSFLESHALMLSKEASANSIPSLVIDANDVKASHGATIGKPEEEELFYLMARGLDRKKSEKIIIEGFFSEITDKLDESGRKSALELLGVN